MAGYFGGGLFVALLVPAIFWYIAYWLRLHSHARTVAVMRFHLWHAGPLRRAAARLLLPMPGESPSVFPALEVTVLSARPEETEIFEDWDRAAAEAAAAAAGGSKLVGGSRGAAGWQQGALMWATARAAPASPKTTQAAAHGPPVGRPFGFGGRASFGKDAPSKGRQSLPSCIPRLSETSAGGTGLGTLNGAADPRRSSGAGGDWRAPAGARPSLLDAPRGGGSGVLPGGAVRRTSVRSATNSVAEGSARRGTARDYNSIDLPRRTSQLNANGVSPPLNVLRDDDDAPARLQTGIEQILPRLGDILGAEVILAQERLSDCGGGEAEAVVESFGTSSHGERAAAATAASSALHAPELLSGSASPSAVSLRPHAAKVGSESAGWVRSDPEAWTGQDADSNNKVSLTASVSAVSVHSLSRGGRDRGESRMSSLISFDASLGVPKTIISEGSEGTIFQLVAAAQGSPSSPTPTSPPLASLDETAATDAGAHCTAAPADAAASAEAEDHPPLPPHHQSRASRASRASHRGSLSDSEFHAPQLRRGFVEKQLNWLMRVRCEGVRLREFTPGVDLSGFVDAAVCTAIVVSFFIWTSVRPYSAQTRRYPALPGAPSSPRAPSPRAQYTRCHPQSSTIIAGEHGAAPPVLVRPSRHPPRAQPRAVPVREAAVASAGADTGGMLVGRSIRRRMRQQVEAPHCCKAQQLRIALFPSHNPSLSTRTFRSAATAPRTSASPSVSASPATSSAPWACHSRCCTSSSRTSAACTSRTRSSASVSSTRRGGGRRPI